MPLLAQVDWVELWRSGGFSAIIVIVAARGVIGAAKWFKSTMEGTLADARAERNKEREDARAERDEFRRLIENQANKHLESLRVRDQIQKEGFDEILRELRSNHTRRK